MTFNLLDIIQSLFNVIGSIISNFTIAKTTLENTLTQIDSFDFITLINPYVGTIRYVSGDVIFNMTVRIVQLALFIGLAKAAYQLVYMLTNSVLIKKPIELIKSFVGL